MIRASQIETARARGAAPAAPPGGAQAIGGRGCGLAGFRTGSFFRHHPSLRFGLISALVAALSLFDTGQAIAESSTADQPSEVLVPVSVPSGQKVLLSEVLLDDSAGALWARFRFVAPQIARSIDPAAGSTAMDYERSAADMDHLCEALALDYLRQHAVSAQLVVISFSDREVEFGSADAEATQFFEAYRPEGDSCIWEAF